jgi:ABC-type antimicrobial peptide transport system ATPase subunit
MGDTKLRSKSRNVLAIYQLIAELQNPRDVSQVFVGTTLSVINELAKDNIFSRRNGAISIGKKENAFATFELCSNPRTIASDHEIDLRA